MPRLLDRARVGWAAARTHLERCKDDARCDLMADLVMRCDVQGAPAMAYAAQLIRWRFGEVGSPTPPGKLVEHERAYIRRRVDELTEPYRRN